jgi:uncharacterized protein (TIGR00369 family)
VSTHERSVRWVDPRAAREAVAGRRLSGLEMLREMATGALPPPPLGVLLGFEVDEVEPGRVVFGLQPGEHHYNPNGVLHGGVAATLLDTVTGCAVMTLLPFGETCATLELKVNYIRSISAASPRLRAVGTVLHRGRRSAVAEGRLLLPGDKLVAHATATLLLFPPDELHGGDRPPGAGPPGSGPEAGSG